MPNIKPKDAQVRYQNPNYRADIMNQLEKNFGQNYITDNGSDINDNLSDVVGSKGAFGVA